MTKASDNIFPQVIVVEGSAPSSPSATNFKLFVDSSDHLLKIKNSAGTVTAFATGTGSFSFLGAKVTEATQNITNATITALTFGTETYDTTAFHDAGAPTRLTIPTTGKYRVSMGGYFGFAVSNELDLWVGLNGTNTLSAALLGTQAYSTAGKNINASSDLLLTAADYIQAFVYHDNGSTRAFTNAYFTIQRLDP